LPLPTLRTVAEERIRQRGKTVGAIFSELVFWLDLGGDEIWEKGGPIGPMTEGAIRGEGEGTSRTWMPKKKKIK